MLRGQPLIFSDHINIPVHSPTSGYIEDIFFEKNPANNQKNIRIIIVSDYLDKWIKLKIIKNYTKYTPEQLIKIIHYSGVSGLGGAEFPSSKKLTLSINKVHTLIVNAIESEPDITADSCLINNYIDEILEGCKIIAWITKIKNIIIAIQEDKIELISKIHDLIDNQSLFKVCIFNTKYPGGSSKILIKALTGKEIPYKKHAVDIGYLIFNVATIFAIKRSVMNGEPLTERIVTFLGEKDFLSGNFWMRIGTPIAYCLTNMTMKKNFILSVYSGGSFMGEKIDHTSDVILKKTNCISIKFKKSNISSNILESNCVRCHYCSSVCPINLLPQQLYWYIKNKNHEKTKKHHVFDCIECKICEKVCPSRIPLVKYFQKEKNILKNITLEKKFKELSLMRFTKRQERLLNRKNIIHTYNIENRGDILVSHSKIKTIQNQDIHNTHIKKNIRKAIIQEAIKRVKSKK